MTMSSVHDKFRGIRFIDHHNDYSFNTICADNRAEMDRQLVRLKDVRVKIFYNTDFFHIFVTVR